MTEDPPQFHTKALSPLSPLPVHPSEPSSIPVLRNQTDTTFNMTSTHLTTGISVLASSTPSAPAPTSRESSPSDDSNFSDAYKDDAEEVKGKRVKDTTQVTDDEYAMMFDSDGEERATDSKDLSKTINEPDTKSLVKTEAPSTVVSLDSVHESSIRPPTHSPSLPSIEHTTVKVEFPESKAAQPYPTELNTSKQQQYDEIANGGIDIQQLLDNITANAEKNESASTTSGSSSHPSNPSLPKNNSGLPSHSSLPPRPNVPQMPSLPDDGRNFYAGAPGLPPASNSYRPPGGNASLIAGFPGRPTDPRGGLPPPPSASFRGPPPVLNIMNPASGLQNNRSSGQDQQAQSIGSQNEADELDAKWGPDVQKIYDDFLEDERHYVTEGLWDRFPMGSRLFIGNLPSESVTKRDLFHVFHHYGRIAQISIKQAYGFVQFHDSAACYAALNREEGTEVRGRKIHLEISKPQKNKVADQGVNPRGNRPSDGPKGGGRSRNDDHYNTRPSPTTRTDEYGRPIRIRDDYRNSRQPSPPRGNFRGRDDFAPRGRESYDGRDHRRDRSRSPQYGNREDTRYRQRSLSPRAREAMEDADLQIPRRESHNVPDIQIILMDQLDRQFVSWVENELRGRGIKVEVMFLSPRLPIEAVIRRQVLEGVQAISKLDMRSQNTSQMPLRLFKRQAGGSSVQFDEYADLEPKIAAELVIRAKQAQVQPQVQPQTPNTPYAQPQFPAGQTYQPPAAAGTPNLANLVGSLDNASLQKLLSTLAPQQQQNNPAAAANSAIDLAGLLSGLQPQVQPQGYAPVQNTASYSNVANNAALASLLGGQHQQQQQQQAASAQGQQQSAQQVQNIMAQLARFSSRQ